MIFGIIKQPYLEIGPWGRNLTFASCNRLTEDSKNSKQKICQMRCDGGVRAAPLLRETCQAKNKSLPSHLSVSAVAPDWQSKTKLRVFQIYLVLSQLGKAIVTRRKRIGFQRLCFAQLCAVEKNTEDNLMLLLTGTTECICWPEQTKEMHIYFCGFHKWPKT